MANAPLLRPPFLSTALFVLGTMGMFGASNGCGTIQVLRDSDVADRVVAQIHDPHAAAIREASVAAIVAARRIALPLATAQLLLGALLAFAAMAVLMTRGRGLALLLQSAFAYATYLVVEHLLGGTMRMDTLARLQGAAAGRAGSLSPDEVELAARLSPWVYRGALVAQVAALMLGVYALTRPRARAFFAEARARGGGDD